MKDKIIQLTLSAIAAAKEEDNSDITLKITDENKESIYSDLLIPLMEISKSSSVTELHEKLSVILDSDQDIDDNMELVESFVDSIIDEDSEDSIDELTETVNNFVVNCVAIFNNFNALISEAEEDDKKEALTSINDEILAIINIEDDETNTLPDTEETNDEGVTVTKTNVTPDNEGQPTPNVDGNQDGEGDAGTDGAPEDANKTQEEGDSGLVIIDPVDEVDDSQWGEVNKVEMKNSLKEMLDAGEAGVPEAINEIYALVKSADNPADWQWPHHVVKEGKVILNVNGLKTAALFLLKPNSSKNLTTEERATIAKHLMKHYKELKMNEPDKLTTLADGKESTIIVNIKEDDMKEFGELFKVDVEEIGTYVGLMESLLTDFVNSGIIHIESDDTFDESVISVKLNRDQAEEFIKYFDVLSDDIVNILSSNFSGLSYKRESVSDIEAKLLEQTDIVTTLEDKVSELTDTNDELSNSVKTLEEDVAVNGLNNKKFEAIIDFVKSIDNVDETLIQFVSNLIEAQEEAEIKYLAKIGATFMKNSKNEHTPKFIKKLGVTSSVKTSEIDRLAGIMEDSNSNSESGFTPKTLIDKRVDKLSSYFD